MNRIQRWTLIVGLLLVFLAGLFPDKPDWLWLIMTGINNYYFFVGMKWMMIASLTGAVFLIAHKHKKGV